MNIVVHSKAFVEFFSLTEEYIVGGLDRCSFRTRYHTQVPEISSKAEEYITRLNKADPPVDMGREAFSLLTIVHTGSVKTTKAFLVRITFYNASDQPHPQSCPACRSLSNHQSVQYRLTPIG
jgi:hypothetical protein